MDTVVDDLLVTERKLPLWCTRGNIHSLTEIYNFFLQKLNLLEKRPTTAG